MFGSEYFWEEVALVVFVGGFLRFDLEGRVYSRGFGGEREIF